MKPPVRVFPVSPSRVGLDDLLAVAGVSGAGGDTLEELERRLATHFRRQHAVVTSSGTAGLYLALKALLPSSQQPRQVVVPAYTCIRVPNAVLAVPAVPQFVDVDLSDANVAPDALEERITPATGAIVLTHMYGVPGRVDEITGLARARGIPVVEDACLAVGSRFGDVPCGALGDASVISFNQQKQLSAFGGGAVLTDDPDTAARLKQLRQRETGPPTGAYVRSKLRELAVNNLLWHPLGFGLAKQIARRLPSVRRLLPPPDLTSTAMPRLIAHPAFQISLTMSQLRKMERFVLRRERLMRVYDAAFAPEDRLRFRRHPRAVPSLSHYSLRVPVASSALMATLEATLAQRGVQIGRLFNYVCPEVPAYRATDGVRYSGAAQIAATVFNLPFYPHLREDDAREIAGKTLDAIQQVYGRAQ